MTRLWRFAVISFLTFLFACTTKGPVPINYGSDQCDYCRMSISDSRYGAEALTEKRKIHKFDSVECLIAFGHTHPSPKFRNQWVSDFANPGKLIPAESGAYLKSDALKSPMGMNLTAFADLESADRAQQLHGGLRFSWQAVREHVLSSDFVKRTGTAPPSQ